MSVFAGSLKLPAAGERSGFFHDPGKAVIISARSIRGNPSFCIAVSGFVMAMATVHADGTGPKRAGEPAEPGFVASREKRKEMTLDEFLDANNERYRTALSRAKHWLDALEVNPVELRARGIKGKKKLAELLDAYLGLYAVASVDEKPGIASRIRAIAALTATPGYHDMLRIPDRQFHEDATSYLRTAFLMDRFGLDTGLYRKEIKSALPRFNSQMPNRGVNQRMAFHTYYSHFKLEEPFPLAGAFETGVISARRDAAWFKRNKMEIYSLTHEIFAPYEFGEKLDADFFSDSDKACLRPLLEELTAHSISQNDPDIAAELVSCLRYLHFTDQPIYRRGIEFLLESQGQDGKWGNYEQHRHYYGDYVNQAFYLHTTLVALSALNTSFFFREK